MCLAEPEPRKLSDKGLRSRPAGGEFDLLGLCSTRSEEGNSTDGSKYDRVELTAPENTQYEPYNPQYPAHEARYAQQVPQSYA